MSPVRDTSPIDVGDIRSLISAPFPAFYEFHHQVVFLTASASHRITFLMRERQNNKKEDALLSMRCFAERNIADASYKIIYYLGGMVFLSNKLSYLNFSILCKNSNSLLYFVNSNMQ